ncbi:hypothetical protein K437DRAFT_296586 [Tilletiaria anomala UBC 951]|uniref:Uncharacterized protein n=1 Tax=Tilletiaria anomala (strain ATCC 24038 / CBS 436.72 / UBC 951) TaxID=1037660 RepID=A0A066VFG4_TILAU|nr:uncharacterized protein K437DRAFT_296586 [Tilletiaria anomala UBC 951]KDN37310.1 hypothetical protein K437DRAFT_296586 [Tilletiaria anomala UBC 951]
MIPTMKNPSTHLMALEGEGLDRRHVDSGGGGASHACTVKRTAFCGFCEVIPQDPFHSSKRSLFGGSRTGGKLQPLKKTQPPAAPANEVRVPQDALSSPSTASGPRSKASLLALRKISAPPGLDALPALKDYPSYGQSGHRPPVDMTFLGGAELRPVVSEPPLNFEGSRSKEICHATWDISVDSRQSLQTRSEADGRVAEASTRDGKRNIPQSELLNFSSPTSLPGSGEVVLQLKSCLKHKEPQGSEQEASRFEGGAGLDWHALTVKNTRNAALLQSSPSKLGLTVQASSDPMFPLIHQSKGGTGPRVVAPRAVMKALSFGPDFTTDGDVTSTITSTAPAPAPLSMLPSATGSTPAPSTPSAPESAVNITEGPPVVLPEDGASELETVVGGTEFSHMSLSPILPRMEDAEPSVAQHKGHRPSLLGRSSNRLMAKLTSFRGQPDGAGGTDEGDGHLSDGRLIPLNETCSCKDCTPRLLHGLSPDYEIPFSRTAKAKWIRDRQAAQILAEQNMDAQERLARREAILQVRVNSPDMVNMCGSDILRLSSPSPTPRLPGSFASKHPLPRPDGRPAFPLNDDDDGPTDEVPVAEELNSQSIEMPNPFSIPPHKVKADELHMSHSKSELMVEENSASPPSAPVHPTPSPRPPSTSPTPQVPYRSLSPDAYAYLPRSLTPNEASREASAVDQALRASIEAELRRKEERAKRKAKGQLGGARAMYLLLDEAEAREREASIERERLRKETASPIGGCIANIGYDDSTLSITTSPPLRGKSPSIIHRGITPPVRASSPLNRKSSPFHMKHRRQSLSQSAADFAQRLSTPFPGPASSRHLPPLLQDDVRIIRTDLPVVLSSSDVARETVGGDPEQSLMVPSEGKACLSPNLPTIRDREVSTASNRSDPGIPYRHPPPPRRPDSTPVHQGIQKHGSSETPNHANAHETTAAVANARPLSPPVPGKVTSSIKGLLSRRKSSKQ